MPAPKGNNYAEGNSGGGPEGNQYALGNSGGDGGPHGNAKALDHGAYAVPSKLLDHLDDEDTALVEDIQRAYLDRYPGDPGIEVVLDVTEASVIIWQQWSASSELIREGLSQDHSVGVDDAGRPVVIEDHAEHHLVKTRSRLIADAQDLLDRHGLLDDRDDESGEMTLVEEISAAKASKDRD